MNIHHDFNVDLTGVTVEEAMNRIADARRISMWLQVDIARDLDAAEVALMNPGLPRPHPFPAATEVADRLCTTCHGKRFTEEAPTIFGGSTVLETCRACGGTGADVVMLHPIAAE